jgi:chorismate dehydratase
MPYPVAMIPYANMAPYREAGAPPNCVFTPMVPAASVDALRRGAVLAAALPVGALPALGDLVTPVGSYGIGALRACRSVLVFSRRPFAQLRPEDTFRITGESATSIRLLGLLLAENAGAQGLPPAHDRKDGDAAGELLIGDRALLGHRIWREGAGSGGEYDRLLHYGHVTDLAAEWYRRCGYPFVFARWVVHHQAPPEMVEALGHWLDVFRTREAEYVRRAIPRAAAETGLDDALIGEYFHLIRRCFDEIDLAGQARFLHKLKSDRRLTVPAADLKRCA